MSAHFVRLARGTRDELLRLDASKDLEVRVSTADGALLCAVAPTDPLVRVEAPQRRARVSVARCHACHTPRIDLPTRNRSQGSKVRDNGTITRSQISICRVVGMSCRSRALLPSEAHMPTQSR